MLRVLLMLLGISLSAQAFGQVHQRCNSRGCRICSQAVVQEQVIVQQPAAVVPSIYILNQVPAVPSGSTGYVAQPSVQNSLIDVNRLAAQTLQLMKASAESHQETEKRTLSFISDLAKIQLPVAEAYARGQAAALVLQAAGLNQGSAASSQQLFGLQEKPSLLKQVCGKCHQGADAQGGFTLDETFDATAALTQLALRKMPPEPIPDDQRLLIIQEIVELSQEP